VQEPTRAGRERARATIVPPADSPFAVLGLDHRRRQLRQRDIAEGWSKVALREVSIHLVRGRADLGAGDGEPLLEIVSHQQLRWQDVSAIVYGAQQPA
jgi:hypothetical protein